MNTNISEADAARRLFEGRRLFIASMHSKEWALAAPLEEALGVRCFTAANFNTDVFGTFSGEIQRVKSPLETAREKCLKGMSETGSDLAIASEGSFGPHPGYFFVPADEEVVLLLDRKNELEISAVEISTLTNFNSSHISSRTELTAFAERVGFPSHALIVRGQHPEKPVLRKGITDWDTLYDVFASCHDSAQVETDMRAHLNPTRMGVIRKAAQRLVSRINSVCPSCTCPGFDVTSSKTGLPCQLCHSPTKSTLAYISTCLRCNYTEVVDFPNGKTTEDPMFCDVCNP